MNLPISAKIVIYFLIIDAHIQMQANFIQMNLTTVNNR